MKKFLCGLLAVMFLFSVSEPVRVHAASNFTYTYNIWGRPTPSPDAYRVTAFLLGYDLGVGNFSNPQDLFIIDNLLYLVDTGNNRIVVIRANEDDTHEVIQTVTYAVMDGVPTAFNAPEGIFVKDTGHIWLADTRNQRILRMDENWVVVQEITRPAASQLLDTDDFLPSKLAVDFTGRLFVQVHHVNRGLMEFDRYGNFAVYMGAAPVHVSPIDQFWRTIATQEQRERREIFIPTEYNNVNVDSEGFLFVTNTSPDVDSVRRLNAMGNDVLIRNGLFPIEGDVVYGNAVGIEGPSQFIDIAPLPNETFVAFDRVRGRIFAYDFQGNLLYVFGGVGQREGFFMEPAAIANMGLSLFALDSRTAAITRFDMTEYGLAISSALELYRRGMYEESIYYWQEVLRMNGNFGLAYRGMGRAMLRQGNYRQAMHYFRIERDSVGYGRAFGFFRRQWMEDHFWMFALALGALIIIPPVVKRALKIRREIAQS